MNAKYLLYQWPSSEYCDSIYVRCTKIQRLLGFLGIPYKVADITLPFGSEQELAGKIAPLMRKIPVLSVDGNFIENTDSITEFLLGETDTTGFDTEHCPEPELTFFMDHWIEKWLVWLVIYARWYREENFNRFMLTIGKESQRMLLRPGILYTRKRACEILERTEAGSLTLNQYFAQLRSGLATVDRILQRREYLASDHRLTEIDLSLFMCIQAFLDPALKQECDLVLEFNHLSRWAKKVDSETAAEFSKPLYIRRSPGSSHPATCHENKQMKIR